MGRRERRRAERGERPRKRTPRDWEPPGAIVKGPPITVTCECGVKRELAYGERWQCESCGRSWDTGRIPAEQYDEIRRLSLRFRVVPIAFGAVVALLAIFFTLTGNIPGVFFLLPTALLSWFIFLRPLHRRRYRAAIKTLPRWELRAD
ncbi:MAG: hypothetical protein QOI45_209 [Thermoleophilaceae bacterium]|nr:hypothetical protein [Thermoleophilaceae bacterium]